jgi:hypothetical protein
MNAAWSLLLSALRSPQGMQDLSVQEWDALLRHARSSGLLSRLALDAQQAGILTRLPERVERHLRGSVFMAERQQSAVRWETHRIHAALSPLGIPIVLLKGAAYVMAELPPARGRLFGDIDVLVHREHLAEVETQLRYHGWLSTGQDAYDERYYRQWMHEIPPLTHVSRGSTLDVHHNILPITARLKPRAQDLMDRIVPIPGYANLYRLCDADLILHSAAHLFHEGEWNHGIRDLTDLASLMQCFTAKPGFFDELRHRAELLDLLTPFELAAYFVHALLPSQESGAVASALDKPGRFNRWMFHHGFASAHPELTEPGVRLALFFLYVRSHALRMPMHLLIPHLIRKAVKNPSRSTG